MQKSASSAGLHSSATLAEAPDRLEVVEVVMGDIGVPEPPADLDDSGHGRTVDSKGFSVEFLPENGQAGIGIDLTKVFRGHRQHCSRAGRRIIDRPDSPRSGQNSIVFDEEKVH